MPKYQATFRGGNLTVNSGGTGPDDYLLRLNKGGHDWVRVTINRADYWNELALLNFVFSDIQRTDYYDNKKVWSARRAVLDTMNFAEFVEECLAPQLPERFVMTILKYLTYRWLGNAPAYLPSSYIMKYHGEQVTNVRTAFSVAAAGEGNATLVLLGGKVVSVPLYTAIVIERAPEGD